MSPRQPSILFLNHSASRNGASILLLHLLQWLRTHTDFRLEVLTDGSGPLLTEFRAVARTRVWRSPLSLLRRLERSWADAICVRMEGLALRTLLRRRHHDLVYANTAATWKHVAALGRSHGAVLWHIHELPYALRLTLGDEHARALLPTADRVIAVSASVVDALTSNFGVTRERVDLVSGFVSVCHMSPEERLAKRQRILDALHWPSDVFVVGGCGGLGWRKGSDLFVQVVQRLHHCPGARFLWVGGSAADTEALQFTHDVRALGLEAVCCRIPSTPDVDDYYCAMDVFALTSREDPFPLVMLEAAMHGLPTVCFESSGGGCEFVADDAGLVVPYLDVNEFARALEHLQAVPERRKALGQAARDKAIRDHCVETQGPKLLRSIEHCLAAG